jgi:DNA-binding CsgD family transcriptional regulator
VKNPSELLGLSQREGEILKRIHAELSPKEIATELDIPLPTIRSHLRMIYGKIGAVGQVGAALAWQRALSSK